MKAIRVYEHGEPEVLRYEDVAELAPGAGEVVVQIAAVGVNPVETYIRAGLHTKRATPFTLGTDAAGIVSAIGAEVAGFEVGERVYTSGSVSGTYAE